MATYCDPNQVFAPLEVIERLIELRADLGFASAIFLFSENDLAAHLDAYGFDVFALGSFAAVFRFGSYRAPVVPGGDHAHSLTTTH